MADRQNRAAIVRAGQCYRSGDQSQAQELCRQVLTFAQSKTSEKAGDIDEAFEAYQQANNLLPAQFDPEPKFGTDVWTYGDFGPAGWP